MDASNDASSDESTRPLYAERPISNDYATNHDTKDQLKTDTPGGVHPKQLIDLTLRFLSTCSNESLLLVLMCLMGATYIVLGRLGLLLIGATFGAVLHASWEGAGGIHSTGTRNPNRKQLSLDAVHRLLDWEKNRHIGPDEDDSINEEGNFEGLSVLDVDISSLGPLTATAIHSLIDAAMRDYVNYWYDPILPSETTFPISCRGTLTSFIMSVSSHLRRKRAADTLLQFLTNSSSMIIVFLNELCAAFEAAGPSVSAEDAVMQYLESNTESSLSSLLEYQQQRAKLKTISDDILSRFLDSSAYNCVPVRNFLREVLSGVVLESTVSSMSQSRFINGWITYLFSEGESEIMSAIDAGVEGARNHGVTEAKAGTIKEPASVSTDESVTESKRLSQDLGKASNKPDQATEKAMLEAKRLSAMIAAQSLPNHPTQTIYNDEQEKNGVNGDGNASTNPLSDDPVGEQSSKGASVEADPVREDEEVRLSHPGVALNLTTSQSPDFPASSMRDSLDDQRTFTLHRASINVDDSSNSGEKVALRSKPTSDYLIQVEPQSGRSSGWMVFKRYTDFESVHETLGIIARLNGLRFGDSHPVVPPWKGQTRQALARSLERYLQDALQLEPLAESVTMRRFLEKDGGPVAEGADATSKPSFVFPGQAAFENVGKGVLGVLTNAPKEISGGGKAVFEGVSGVFGGGANKRTSVISATDADIKKGRGVVQNAPRPQSSNSEDRKSMRLSSDATDGAFSSRLSESQMANGLASPNEIASFTESSDAPVSTPDSEQSVENDNRISSDSAPVYKDDSTATLVSEKSNTKNVGSVGHRKSTDLPAGRKGQGSPITTDETQMAVELIFAVINELYSLSSAWNIRRTLLNAAKSYILRPGNPSLETIRGLLQESMIDNHTTDEAIGMYLNKLRANALPTADELSSWPSAMSETEKERQREAARRVLVHKGLPQAITSVMGAVASREALGKVFDSLQIEVVARGFIFSILLQAIRAIVL
ncbi:PXA domain-containing protein [Aspergillus unguis]